MHRKTWLLLVIGILVVLLLTPTGMAPKDIGPGPLPPPTAQTGGGNETTNDTANETGNEMRYTGFTFPVQPNMSFVSPPEDVGGILKVSLTATGPFDPLMNVPPPPLNLTTSYGPNEIGHYLLQLTGPPRENWTQQLVTLGVSLAYYIAEYAYIIEMNSSNLRTLVARLNNEVIDGRQLRVVIDEVAFILGQSLVESIERGVRTNEREFTVATHS